MKCPHCGHDDSEPFTLEQCLDMAKHPSVGMKADSATDFWAHYASVGFVDAAGRKIVNLRAALIKWRANQPSHNKVYKEESATPNWKKLELLEKIVSEFTARYPHPDRWTPEQIGALRKNRIEIARLKQEMTR